MPDRRLLKAVPWSIVGLFAVVGAVSLVPPSALPVDAPVIEFSAARASDHIDEIATAPHPMGSAAIAEVRGYLLGELESLGLAPETQATSAPSYYEPGPPVELVNVVATIPGTASTGAIVLVAHYDTVPAAPGANDNSAAVASLLEAGRALLAGPAVRNDVVLLFTDGEEPAPQFGSAAFVQDHPAFGDTALVVNFEAIGNAGPSMLLETSGPGAWLVDQLSVAVPHPTAFSFVDEIVKMIGEVGTDFDAFRNAGVPGYNFAYLRGSPIYHTSADDIDSVSAASVQHHGSYALGIARHFGDLDLSRMPDDNPAVYFTLWPFFVQYSPMLSVVLTLVAAAVLMWGVSKARHRGRSIRGHAGSAGRALLNVLGSTVAATVVWVVITSIRSTPSIIESYLYVMLIAGAIAWGASWFTARRGGPPRPTDAGFVIVWIVLAVITSFGAPGMSYLFVWTALAAAVANAWRPLEQPWMSAVRFGMVSAPAVVLSLPAVEVFLQMGQPHPGNPDSNIPFVAGASFLLIALVRGVLVEVWKQGQRAADGTEVPRLDHQAGAGAISLGASILRDQPTRISSIIRPASSTNAGLVSW